MAEIYFDIDGTIRGGISYEPEYDDLASIVDRIGHVIDPIRNKSYPVTIGSGEVRKTGVGKKIILKMLHSRYLRPLRSGSMNCISGLSNENRIGVLTGREEDVMRKLTVNDLKTDHIIGVDSPISDEGKVIMRPDTYDFKHGSALSKLHYLVSRREKTTEKLILIDNDPEVGLLVQKGAKELGINNIQVFILTTKSTRYKDVKEYLENQGVKVFDTFDELPEIIGS